MLNTRTLLLGVIGIMLLVGGTYLAVSPKGNGTESSPTTPDVVTDDRTSTPTVESEEIEDEDADELEIEDGRDDDSAPVSAAPQVVPGVSTPPTDMLVTQTYTLADIAKHRTAADCWSAVNGKVYDLTSFVSNHPGGSKITKICGIDGTPIFTAQHDSNPKQQDVLTTLYIGELVN